ncbi:hypothetical protein [Protaetiibacter intestinalis]|uniref:Uncharacterized protein n=1 Tax=Protaetiibacter intestinalis TaxID=2419774 RepID=A0A387B0K2_9MICO|nr:hypothetical protein [Protaetiibacter intestinalis]AYF97014.1 hypothetical protein D7I47_01255 [Protaetiibacter intestinalis]
MGHRALPVVVAFLAAAALMLSGCTSAGPSTTTGPALPLLDGQHLAKPAAAFQYGAFDVTVGYAVYDDVTQSLYLGTRWRNLSDDYATAPSQFGIAQLRLEPDAEPVTGDVVGWDQSSVPPGASADLTFEWHYLTGDPLAAGVVGFGAAGGRMTTVALADGGGEQHLAAREVAVDRWANFGPHTVHVYAGLLSAGHLSDNTQSDGDHRVLRLSLDVWNSTASKVGWVASDSLALRLPDGSVVKSRTTPSVREVVWSASEGSWVEFEVPDDAVGDYELLLFRRAPGIFGTPIVGNSAVPIPVVVGDDAVASAERPADDELPIPIVAARPDPDGAVAPDAPAARNIEVDAPAVEVAGCVVELTGATLSPFGVGSQLDLELEVRYDAPDDAEEGVFSVPPSLALPAAVEFGGRMAGAMFLANGLQDGVPLRVTLSFPEIPPDADLSTAVLHLGKNAYISFAGEASPQPDTVHPLRVDPASAGEFTVDISGYRAGSLTDADLPPGMVDLQFLYTVETSSDANQHTLFFNPTSQVFLVRDDDYVTVASTRDYTSILNLEVGVPREVRTTFVVPRSALDGTVYLLVRSRDETDFPTPEGWLETTIPVPLAGPGSES